MELVSVRTAGSNFSSDDRLNSIFDRLVLRIRVTSGGHFAAFDATRINALRHYIDSTGTQPPVSQIVFHVDLRTVTYVLHCARMGLQVATWKLSKRECSLHSDVNG